MEATEKADTSEVGTDAAEDNYSWAKSTSRKVLCTELINNVFSSWHKAATYQMWKSLEKLVQHIDTKYVHDISNDLNNKIKANIVTPFHSTEVMVSDATWEALVHTGQYNIQGDLRAQASMLRTELTADLSDAKLTTKI